MENKQKRPNIIFDDDKVGWQGWIGRLFHFTILNPTILITLIIVVLHLSNKVDILSDEVMGPKGS